jgi:hypothetical protein
MEKVDSGKCVQNTIFVQTDGLTRSHTALTSFSLSVCLHFPVASVVVVIVVVAFPHRFAGLLGGRALVNHSVQIWMTTVMETRHHRPLKLPP